MNKLLPAIFIENEDRNPYQAPTVPQELVRGRISWSVPGVLLAVPLCLGGLAIPLPRIGIPLVAVAAIAGMRAFWMCHRRSFHQSQVGVDFAVRSWIGSLWLAFLLFLSGATCFNLAYFSIGFIALCISYGAQTDVGRTSFIAGLAAGLLAAIFGVFVVARGRWSRGVDPLPLALR